MPKCFRTVCKNDHDSCTHRMNGDMYCIACARMINEAHVRNGAYGEVGLIHIPQQRETVVGRMKQTIKLLGTSLALQEGQYVEVLPAKNLPQEPTKQFFARPLDGMWSDGLWAGVSREWETSIKIDEHDVQIITPTDVFQL